MRVFLIRIAILILILETQMAWQDVLEARLGSDIGIPGSWAWWYGRVVLAAFATGLAATLPLGQRPNPRWPVLTAWAILGGTLIYLSLPQWILPVDAGIQVFITHSPAANFTYGSPLSWSPFLIALVWGALLGSEYSGRSLLQTEQDYRSVFPGVVEFLLRLIIILLAVQLITTWSQQFSSRLDTGVVAPWFWSFGRIVLSAFLVGLVATVPFRKHLKPQWAPILGWATGFSLIIYNSLPKWLLPLYETLFGPYSIQATHLSFPEEPLFLAALLGAIIGQLRAQAAGP